jgi:hypothetical protein
MRNIAALSVMFLALALIGCGGGESGPPTSDIVTTIPWPMDRDEILTYRVADKDGDEVGAITLTVFPELDGTSSLNQTFTSQSSEDISRVYVDSATLKPSSSIRRIKSSDDETTIETAYTDNGVLIRVGDRQSGLTVPEHSYDNDTSLFLWRTIPFAEGYEASYITIITNRRSRQKVTLEVTGKETVRVEAGQFTAWRLEIRTSNARQVAWYEDAPARRLIKYDNDRGLIFELEN